MKINKLTKYIDRIENESLEINTGAGIPDLKTKQAQNTTLKELKSRAQKALNFVEIFGLDLQLLRLKDPNSYSEECWFISNLANNFLSSFFFFFNHYIHLFLTNTVQNK